MPLRRGERRTPVAIPDLTGISPARSASVFRFGSRSLPRRMDAIFWDEYLCSAQLPELNSQADFEIVAGSFEGSLVRTFPSDSEISKSGFPGDGIRLGGRICDFRMI